ncbi:S-layer homology domain-containing protein [Thermobacillus xylanilyticus]|nr:S-layer homology domain-containing protein [Thermobacillus xylanilyticus]
MKKSLSLLVAIAMVFSMFATVAAAATDTQSKYNELKKAGVFRGTGDGSAALENEMTRAEFAGIIARLTGVTSSGTAKFNDVPSSHWASKDIAAVAEAGYMEGTGNNNFAPSKNVTLQELIKVAVTIVGLEIDEDATVDGKAGAWAQPYIAAAIAAGLIQPLGDYTVNATRGDLVDVTYEVYQVLQNIAKVTGYEVVSATKVVVSFSDGGKVEVELDEPLKLGKNTITVTYNDREYKVEVEFEATAATAKQVGAKTIEVAFNKAIDDSKVKFAVKNGIISRDVAKVTVSDDKKKAIVELTTRLQNGDSVVTISGIEANNIEAKFQAEDERVTQLKFKSDKLALQSLTDFTKAKVGFQVLNQFGEETTLAYSPNFVVSKAGATASAANGVLTVTATNTNPFYLNEQVMITGYLSVSTYVVTFSETLSVGQPSQIDSIEFKGVYHDDNKQLNTSSKFEDFYVLIEAKDQYGNKLKATDVQNGVLYSVTNPMIFQIKGIVDNKGPNKDQVAIQLADPVYALGYDGTNTIRIQSYSGKTFTYDVQVPKAATVAKIALSAPNQVVASNDDSVKIPFVAEDQNGNRITKYSELKDKLEVLPSPLAGSTFALKEDYVTKEAYLELTLPNNLNVQYALPVYLSVRIKNSAEVASVQFNIEKAWTPESISGLKDVASDLAVNATVSIEPKHVVVKDNYGRDKELKDLFPNYKVVIEPVDNTWDVIAVKADPTDALKSNNELTFDGDKITFEGKVKGSERVKVQLVNTAENKVVYSYEGFIFNVVDKSNIADYTVDDIPKMSNKANREVELKVYGKRSNSTTVQLPKDEYSVTATSGLTYDENTGKLSANGINGGFDNNGELKAKVVVTIKATSQTIEKEVVISKADLVPTTIELKDSGNLKGSNGVIKGPQGDVANLATVFQALKIKDQFGFEMNGANPDEVNGAASQFNATVSITDEDDANKSMVVTNNGKSADTVTIAGVEKGDSYTVVFTSKASGVSITVKVVAES